jgi:hypothetical protein
MYNGLRPSPPIFEFQMCIGVMLKLRKESQNEPVEDTSWHPPNQTR